MRVIPVIDILKGKAVHARHGQREGYRPLKSILCETPDPVEVARAYQSAFGFEEIYVADLDSITKGEMNLGLLRRIPLESNLRVMVDAGVDTLEKAECLIDEGASKVIVGTETLHEISDLTRILDGLGRDLVIVSLDAMGGTIISKSKELNGLRPEDAAKNMEAFGVEEIIFLELSRVGGERGAATEDISRVVKEVALSVIVGGGVRDIDDLFVLRDLGVSGVLVATALHNGMIRREDLRLLE